MARREAGPPGELIAGHVDQAKSQWAAGEVAAVVSFWSTVPTQQRADLPLVFQPCVWRVFSTTSVKTRKNQACQNQGSVFNIIMTPVKTINITQNQREKRRTSLGQCGERRPTLPLYAVPGGYRNPLVFTLGAQAAETWCPNHGQGTPSGGSGEVVSPWRLWK